MKTFERSFYSKTSMHVFIVTLILFLSMWLSTDMFTDIDMALMGYIISSFIFAIGLTVRISSFLIRPATAQIVKRSFTNMKKQKRVKRNVKSILITLVENIILQKFIFKRGIYRGVQHFLIAWGCIGSFAITFGLTFGWLRFDLIDPETYQIVAFNIPTMKMAAHGLFAELVYNGLNITALMVLIGVSMALARRLVNKDVRVTQRVEFDLLPLYILLAVTVSGLVLTVSYHFLGGWMHHYLTLVHQVTVVIMLIYFPYGKLFHLPIRPLATAVPMNYQETLKVDTRECKKCGSPYSSDDQIADVKQILNVQSFDLKLDDGSYLADYCLPCRRRIRVMKQLNIESVPGNPYAPINTLNDIHMSGFGKRRSDEFYNLPEKEKNEIVK
ncbi:MFS transporter [Litchfieldia alkalitelluris]|uniref:MFS transporter n=1 Tax=Litchfieldia alkalitelluris TaxID=304268 RepID=UPI000998BCEF|nr:MFS transporter [Litchfieldia alkalitelluris]